MNQWIKSEIRQIQVMTYETFLVILNTKPALRKSFVKSKSLETRILSSLKKYYVKTITSVENTVWKNEKFSLTEIFFSSNQLFSSFFSRTINFTKFLWKKCEREFLQFPHCGKVLKNAITQKKKIREINSSVTSLVRTLISRKIWVTGTLWKNVKFTLTQKFFVKSTLQ